ncbi:MAG: hypothetical protein KDA53_12265 [Hyphomonas sp.]|nr:hypothetical protein [Hyphomonas sp.]
MLKSILRCSTALALPLMMGGLAHADYGYEDPAYQGEYRGEAALILYSGENFTGDIRQIFDPIPALPDLYFNDAARSVSVLAGQWEVCEHSDFTGRCVFLREDVPDLGWFGLNREISSVRPVYEYTDAEHGLMFVRDDNGYIRYVDNAHYGYDDYSYGYGATTAVSVYHYGYSSDYARYGYYDPRLGYDPYGFGWHYGSYYHRELPPLRGHYGARDANVTLYVDPNGRGASYGTNRAIPDLSRYRFNDNVSSINIRSGKWEICEHANFTGRCQIVDASVDKLNGIRLNDNISSIRPVGDSGRGKGDWRPGHGWTGGDRGGDRGRDRGGDRDRDHERDRAGDRDHDRDRDRGGQRGRPGPDGARTAVPAPGVSTSPSPAPRALTSPPAAPRTITPRPGADRSARSDRPDRAGRPDRPRRDDSLAGGLPDTPAMRTRRVEAPRAPNPGTAPRGETRRLDQPRIENPRIEEPTRRPPERRIERPAERRIETPRAVEPPARISSPPPPPPPRARPQVSTSSKPPSMRTQRPSRPAYTPPPAPRVSSPPPPPPPRVSSPPPPPPPKAERIPDRRPPSMRKRDN